MKIIKISILAAFFGLMSFATLPTEGNPTVKTASASAIAWKSDVIELGQITQNKPQAIVFEFKNTGTSDILITNVKPACGCTATDYTKTPIKPGQNAVINATYNAAAKGAFTKTVTVTTNNESTPKVLTFKGTVI